MLCWLVVCIDCRGDCFCVLFMQVGLCFKFVLVCGCSCCFVGGATL